MPLSKPQLQFVLELHERILDAAEHFIRDRLEVRRVSGIRVSGGKFQYETNTACSCHPEYEWVDLTPEQDAQLTAELQTWDFSGPGSPDAEIRWEPEE